MILNHQHLIVDAKLRKPPRSTEAVEDWLLRLVTALKMELFLSPVAKECRDPNNEGISGIVMLTTSHASIHFWSEVAEPYVRCDIYSCKEFGWSQVEPLLSEFDLYEVRKVWLDRN